MNSTTDPCAAFNDSFTCKTFDYIDARVDMYTRNTQYQWEAVPGTHRDSLSLAEAHASFQLTHDNEIVNTCSKSEVLNSLIAEGIGYGKNLTVSRTPSGIFIWDGIKQDYYGSPYTISVKRDGVYCYVTYGGVDWVGSSGGSKTYYSFILKRR